MTQFWGNSWGVSWGNSWGSGSENYSQIVLQPISISGQGLVGSIGSSNIVIASITASSSGNVHENIYGSTNLSISPISIYSQGKTGHVGVSTLIARPVSLRASNRSASSFPKYIHLSGQFTGQFTGNR